MLCSSPVPHQPQVGEAPGEAVALKETFVPPQPAGPGPRLPKVYCIISCIGSFGLFSKVGVEQDSSYPVGPVQLLGSAWLLALPVQPEPLVELLPDSLARIEGTWEN
jgi:hypothetical protein